MNRIVKVAQMQMLNRNTFIGVPLIILGGSFALALIIIAMIPTDEFKFAGGAAFAPIWYFIGAGVYGLTLTFPFSQAMSVTRREFFLGTLLTAAAAGTGLAVLYVVMGYLEQATGGWWMNGGIFRVPGIWEAGPLATGLTYLMLTLLMFVIGFIFAIVYRRWGVPLFVSILVVLALALVGSLFVIGRMNAWVAVFGALGNIGAFDWVAIGFAVTLVLSVIAARLLRRTVA